MPYSPPPSLSLLELDLFPERLALAKELGADFQLKVTKEVEPPQLAKNMEDLLGVQPHVAIECTGVERSVQTAVYVRDVEDLVWATFEAPPPACQNVSYIYRELMRS